MTTFKARKVLSSLPSTLEADTVYAVRVGAGFDLFITDSTGLIAHQINEAGVAKTYETVSKNLPASNATLAYTEGVLTSITYSNGVVKTLSYEGDVLATVTLSGSTPGGISLIKTLSYTDGKLTGVSYT
jgi:hypothetical protein